MYDLGVLQGPSTNSIVCLFSSIHLPNPIIVANYIYIVFFMLLTVSFCVLETGAVQSGTACVKLGWHWDNHGHKITVSPFLWIQIHPQMWRRHRPRRHLFAHSEGMCLYTSKYVKSDQIYAFWFGKNHEHDAISISLCHTNIMFTINTLW